MIDGDTIWLNGDKIRIADINTPETSEPACGQKKWDLFFRVFSCYPL